MRNYRCSFPYEYSKLYALCEEFAYRPENGTSPSFSQYRRQRLAEFALAYKVFTTVEQLRPSVLGILDPLATQEPGDWLKNYNLARLETYLRVSDDQILTVEKYGKRMDKLKVLVTGRFMNFLTGWCTRFDAQKPPERTRQPRNWLRCRERNYSLLAELWTQVRIHYQQDKTGFWCGVDRSHEAWGFLYFDQTKEH